MPSARRAAAPDEPPKKVEKRLQWTPTLQVRIGLDQIEEKGFYGDTLSHVVNYIVTKEIAELLRLGMLKVEELDAIRDEARAAYGPAVGASQSQDDLAG